MAARFGYFDKWFGEMAFSNISLKKRKMGPIRMLASVFFFCYFVDPQPSWLLHHKKCRLFWDLSKIENIIYISNAR